MRNARSNAGTALLRLAVLASLALSCGAREGLSSAAEPASQLLVPVDAPVRPGSGQRVRLDGDGSQLALLHADVGERRLVILSDGRLESVPAAQAPRTDAPFRPATRDEIAATLKKQGFSDFKVRSTARFVYVYNTSEEFYKGTSRILETMYPAVLAYFKRLKIPVDHPPVPLVAVMFRTEEEFQRFEEVPEGIAAYYNAISNRIVMYEQSTLVEVAPELAMKQSIGTIAHEGVHQILHNIGVQQRLSRWPLWLAEGLAEYFAPTSVDRRLRWKGVGMPHDLRMYELSQHLREKSQPEGALVEQIVAAERLNSSGYATAWSLTHYLATKHKDKFHAYIREVAQLGPLEPRDRAGEHGRAIYVRHFGDDFAATERALLAHLKSLPYVDPIANQTHYVVLLDSNSSRTVGVTTSPSNARKFQEDALTKLPPGVRANARLQILPFANKQTAEAYAQRLLGGSE